MKRLTIKDKIYPKRCIECKNKTIETQSEYVSCTGKNICKCGGELYYIATPESFKLNNLINKFT